MYLYYSTQRPVGPGTIPTGVKIFGLVNFDRRTYCQEIDGYAWGYFFTQQRLSHEDLKQYELLGFSLRCDDGTTQGIDPSDIVAWAVWDKEYIRLVANDYFGKDISDEKLEELTVNIPFDIIIPEVADTSDIYDEVFDAISEYAESGE